jgi:hypothetical protein
VASSQYLRHDAVREIDDGNECFWLRGLLLAEAYSFVPDPPEEAKV